MLLDDISAARGKPVPAPPKTGSKTPATTVTAPAIVHEYLFNLLLASATIPYSLSSHLDTYHPNMTRLVSPRLHRLPGTLKTEYVSYGQAGGNRLADIERRLQAVWREDDGEGRERGKVVVFVNKGSKVEEVRKALEARGVKAVGLSGASEGRVWGSNRHLEGFLKPMGKEGEEAKPKVEAEDAPRVLITTSLLSRGLDFAPEVRHVFVLDSPRNMVDFLHRAGRSARAGREGTVVVFGKVKGRGGEEGREVRRKVRAVAR
jgi:ATP-dependent RNA helicase MRH4, mitochondrial